MQGYEVDGRIVSHEEMEQTQRDEAQRAQSWLVGQRDEWVRARQQSGIEDAWRTAEALYWSSDTKGDPFVDALKVGPTPRSTATAMPRSKVIVNIVRPKVDQAAARMCEILLPTDDKNWGIKPTPVADAVSKMIGDQRPTVVPGTDEPTGMTADGEARAVVDATTKAAEEMERAIDDPLTECDYNAHQRRAIVSAVMLGTGIIEGPFPARQQSKAWVRQPDGSHVMVQSEKVVPASAFRSTWDIWFDPSCGDDHQRGAGYWGRRFVTRRELRDLVGLDGYDADAIRSVLRMAPNRVRVAEGRVSRYVGESDKSYEMWTYHGFIEPDHMACYSQRTGDPLEDVDFGVVVMVNDVVIGAMKSWVPDQSLPVDVYCWRKRSDSPHGQGLCEELEHQQRVVTAAWRQVMDNARQASSSQVVKLGGVSPSNGVNIAGQGQIWTADPEKIDDARKAFAVYDFPSHLNELMAIVDAAMKFADYETSMPQIMGGERGQAPETVGGMVMLYNTANTVLRMRVKLYDDVVTTPHLKRYFDWMMAYSEDDSIKGDMEIDARGSTALMEKDIQNQATLNLANVTSNPRYQGLIDPKRELQVILKAFKIAPESIMMTDDEVAQAQEAQAGQEQPADPRIEAAKIAADTKRAELADRAAAREMDQVISAKLAELKEREIAFQAERERAEGEQNIAKMGLDRELAIAKLAQDGETSQAERASRERLEAIKLDQKAQLFNAEAQLRINTGAGI
jgi:hypothetical protein